MSSQPPYGQGYQGEGYPPPSSPTGKTKVLNLDYNIAALLSYLPICCINVIASIIWIASEPKENRFLRFHALQSLFLTGVSFVILIVFNFLGVGMSFAGSAGAAGSGLIFLLYWVILLIILVVHIIAMVKAYQGQMWKLPVIGDLADKNA